MDYEGLTSSYCGAEQQAAYRFLHNGKASDEDILQPHREALLERAQLESTVLLVQDTTTLNYTGLGGSTRGLGPLKERSSSARGLFVHAAVAFVWRQSKTPGAQFQSSPSRRSRNGGGRWGWSIYEVSDYLGCGSYGSRVVPEVECTS